MKSFFIRLIQRFGIVLIIAMIHLIVPLVLPQPWSSINIIFIFLILFMLRQGTGAVVWVAFGAAFFTELYAAAPFGIILFALTISMLLSYWLFQYVFTNRSWYAAMAACLCGLTIYRILYTGLIFVTQWIAHLPSAPLLFLLQAYGWEAVLTTSLTGFLYLILYALERPRARLVLFR